MSDTRPVWLTREQRDLLALHGWRRESDAWDAAPAHAERVVLAEIGLGYFDERDATRAVLRVLGMPPA